MDSYCDGNRRSDRWYKIVLTCVSFQLLNVVVSLLLGGHGHGHGHDYDHDHDHSHTYSHSSPPTINHHDAESSNHQDATMHHKTTRQDVDESAVELAYTPPCCAKDPVGQLDTFKKMASVLQHEQESEDGQDDDDDDLNENIKDDVDVVVDDNPLLSETHAHDCKDQMNPITGNDVEQTPMTGTENNKSTEEKKRLVKMGMSTALAIGLHNFPEGLATFVAALNDPKVGVVLAIAISIHNIPEGLCVALPIFYATGHRTKAFLWALLSGASEIVAAFLGWLILSNVFTDATYATLFGLVAGMMVIISIRELLPTAHFYDPEDTVVTYSFITGMVVMALSLVLFIL